MIGLISDTHGLLRPEVVPALAGADLILHAGDIGTGEVMEQLRSLGPVVAVRGNNDRGAWADAILEREVAQVGSVCIYMLHDLHDLDLSPVAAGFQVVVSGHPSTAHRAARRRPVRQSGQRRSPEVQPAGDRGAAHD